MVILEQGVKIKWALPWPHSTALRGFPGHSTRRVNWAGTRWILWAKEMVLRIWGNQDSYRFQYRVSDRRVLHSLWIVPLRSILQVLIGPCVWGNSLRLEKNHLRRSEGTGHTGPGSAAVLSSQTTEPPNPQGTEWCSQMDLVSAVENN